MWHTVYDKMTLLQVPCPCLLTLLIYLTNVRLTVVFQFCNLVKVICHLLHVITSKSSPKN